MQHIYFFMRNKLTPHDARPTTAINRNIITSHYILHYIRKKKRPSTTSTPRPNKFASTTCKRTNSTPQLGDNNAIFYRTQKPRNSHKSATTINKRDVEHLRPQHRKKSICVCVARESLMNIQQMHVLPFSWPS